MVKDKERRQKPDNKNDNNQTGERAEIQSEGERDQQQLGRKKTDNKRMTAIRHKKEQRNKVKEKDTQSNLEKRQSFKPDNKAGQQQDKRGMREYVEMVKANGNEDPKPPKELQPLIQASVSVSVPRCDLSALDLTAVWCELQPGTLILMQRHACGRVKQCVNIKASDQSEPL
ncbi:hypothetical protein WMY93_013197 [Mugilogobius chulae]|uniref:Uncharacterized protein n=1 Tax=Mugilogobius chulae TaxID=88201 RepID=A0AAW0P5P9_9GOBI